MSIGRSIMTFSPPPTPKILNLPSRPRRKQPKNAARKPPLSATDPELYRKYRGRFDTLFCQDVPIVLLNSSGGGESEKRERVEEEREENGGFVEDKWRSQAQIMRAECNVLRMDTEFALKKLERNRVQTERTLRSAVQTMASGRKKIYKERNVSSGLEEEIEDLEEKLEELQRSSGAEDFEVLKSSNFDKKASLLQYRQEKLGGLSDEKCEKEIQKMAEPSLSIDTSCDNRFASGHKSNTDVETQRRNMEGLSKGMLLERMEEEYGSMLSATANSPVASSVPNSKENEFLDSSTRHPKQEVTSLEENKCSGRCKATVRRIIEQVRAETEQWSQMQKMLGQVREEMEKLQASRDFWEDRALNSDNEIQFLNSSVLEWRHKALTFETKANELQTEMSVLREEFEKLRIEQDREVTPTKKPPLISLGKHIQMEKRKLIWRLKENHHTNDKVSKRENFRNGRSKAETCNNQKRSPFQDVGNSSPLERQSSKSKSIFPLHCSEPSKTEESF